MQAIMTDRDKMRANFAAMFLQGFLEGENGWTERALDMAFSDKAVKFSVKLADDLLRELEKKV